MEGGDDRRGGATPARADRIAAAVVVVLLLASLARSVVRPRPAEPGPAAPSTGDSPKPPGDSERSAPPTRTGSHIRFEVQAEVNVRESGPPLELRLRSKSGAARTFDFTTRPEPTRTRFALEVDLPIEQPDLPIRGELCGESWCIPPGLLEFEVARLDAPCSLVVARARKVGVAAQDEAGRPLPGVRIVHESGRTLATTAADGVAKLVRPLRAERDALVAMGDGFAPALVESGAPVVLRRASEMGRLHGVVRAADGSALAGASIEPRWFPGGTPPGASKSGADAAARGLYRLAERSRDHPLAALSATSGADGGFEMALPFGGRLILTATHRDFGRCSLTLDLSSDAAAAGRRTDAELRFARRTALAVTATLDGAPASRCVVEVVESGGDGPVVVAAATSDAKGSAALAVPELPSLYLVLRSDRSAPRVVEFDPKGEAALAQEVALERGRPLRLELAGGDGLEAAGQVVEARDGASRILLATATADAHGAVRFARLPSARPFDLTLKALGAEAPRLAEGLVLEKLAAAGDLAEVDLGELALKRK
jgi:hypothetical protein